MIRALRKKCWPVLLLFLLCTCQTMWLAVNASEGLQGKVEVDDGDGVSTNAQSTTRLQRGKVDNQTLRSEVGATKANQLLHGQTGALSGSAKANQMLQGQAGTLSGTAKNQILQGEVGTLGAAASSSSQTNNLQANVESNSNLRIPRNSGPKGFLGCNTLSNHTGVSPYYTNSPAYVQAIFLPSNLKAAGVQPGDLILDIDGKPPEFMSYNPELYPVGTSVSLTFNNNGSIKHATVKLIPFDTFQTEWMDWIKTNAASFAMSHPELTHQFNTTGAF
jgi:hypothetical protein